MPLTRKQWNVVVILHYVAMFDLLTTMAGVTMGAKEINPLFNHIDSPPIMFAVMFVANLAVTLVIIMYLNIINKGDSLVRYNHPEVFTTALLIVCGLRLYIGPISNILTIYGV